MIFIYLDCIVFHLFLEIFFDKFLYKIILLIFSIIRIILILVILLWFLFFFINSCYLILILILCYWFLYYFRFSHQTLLFQLSSAVCRLFRHDCLKWLKPLQKTLCNLRHIPNRLIPCLHCFLHWFH